MAKALLLLRSVEGKEGALKDWLVTFSEQIHREHGEGSSIRLMAAVKEDLLCNRPRPDHPTDVTVEIKSRPGLPLETVLQSWSGLADRLTDVLDAKRSLALVVHEREFRPAPEQPICYHYLMVRREGFSPADYWDYYTQYHAHFGMITTGIEGYAQNLVDQEASIKLAQDTGVGYREVTSISEMHIADMETFLGAPDMADIAPRAAEDEARFIDREASVMYSAEVVLSLGDQSSIKNSRFASIEGAPLRES